MTARQVLNAADADSHLRVAEESLWQADVIGSFATRGWALYECGEFHPASYLDCRHIVESGCSMDHLEYGVRHLLFPLVKNCTHWRTVLDMIIALLGQGRGPYYIEMNSGIDESGELWVEQIGRYLIDSVIISPPFVRLLIDRRLSRIKDPERIRHLHGDIELPIPFTKLHKIRNQLMMAVRRL